MSVQSEIERISENVASTYSVLDELGADMPAEQNTDNLAETAATVKAVRYNAQTLTAEDQQQARTNIGAASSTEVSQLSEEIADQYAKKSAIPTKMSQLTNDSGYLTKHQDVSGKEDKSNKVTNLSASSTDQQYPSAKCVYDMIGNVEALLAAL